MRGKRITPSVRMRPPSSDRTAFILCFIHVLCHLEQVEEFRKNIVLLDIFYGKMSFQRLEEDLAYDGLDMIGEWYTTSTFAVLSNE